ncbi:MAG: hypothetical protein QOH60_2754 [Mycobacterium sp.]|jgi:hypothetical protein|nr:hypothetical protein [Mycobacterium sp.]
MHLASHEMLSARTAMMAAAIGLLTLAPRLHPIGSEDLIEGKSQ